MNATAAEFIRKILDIIGSEQSQPEPTAVQQPQVIVVQPQEQNPFPEDEHTSDDTGGIMVPPLQQKMELLKKVAGVDSVYDKPGEEEDELSIIRRNAGMPAAVKMAVEDDDVME